jgi:hypothetical protein
MILAHTIEAMIGDKPARVQCNTCKSQHSYKANKPTEGTRRKRDTEGQAGATPTVGKKRKSQYEGLLESKDMALAKRYSPKDKYTQGDVVEHPTFGIGITKTVKDETKIEVLFKDGVKLLIHGR